MKGNGVNLVLFYLMRLRVFFLLLFLSLRRLLAYFSAGSSD
jgi:hypothetical protein